jgi:hypothetical protein
MADPLFEEHLSALYTRSVGGRSDIVIRRADIDALSVNGATGLSVRFETINVGCGLQYGAFQNRWRGRRQG